MTVTKEIFKQPTLEVTANQLAEHLPDGDAWEAKYVDGTNLRGLVVGSADPFNTVQAELELLCNEFHISATTLLIDEWEESVDLPDDCLGAFADLETRRALVIERFRKVPTVTLQEMQDFVDRIFVGGGILLFTGVEYYSFELTFESEFIADINEKFVIVAEIPIQEPTFEYEFEFDFTGAADNEKLRCVLERIIPANVVLLIREARNR